MADPDISDSWECNILVGRCRTYHSSLYPDAKSFLTDSSMVSVTDASFVSSTEAWQGVVLNLVITNTS